MQKPADNVTLSAEAGEALIARVHQSNLGAEDAGVVEGVIRMYCWVAFALQEARRSMKRLRAVFFGPGRNAKAPPAPEAASPASEARGEGAGASPSEASPKATGGHRPGTGRLSADAYGGAKRTECRHEELAVGQRCPVCGQGTFYELPPGVDMRIDGHALLSAMRYE